MAKKETKKNVQKNGIMINGHFSDTNGAIICLYDIISANEKERINDKNQLMTRISSLTNDKEILHQKIILLKNQIDKQNYDYKAIVNYLKTPWLKRNIDSL